MTRRRSGPLIFGVRLSVLLELYRRRLRDHAVAELLAGSGVAVGVALVFGVLVANGSILSSVREDARAIGGSAALQFVSRPPASFSQRLAAEVSRQPGVALAAPVLRRTAVIAGPRGRERIQFVGAGPDLVSLGGDITKDLGAGALLLGRGVGLPSSIAGAVGAEVGEPVRLAVNGLAQSVRVRAILGSGAVGGLASAPLVVARLPFAQTLAEEPGRVNDVLVKPEPGRYRQVERELRALAGGTIDVEPADRELGLAETAARPISQSTSLFVAIAAMVGFLLALNAMLLTVPERRRAIADMRVQGFDSRQVLTIVVFQAMVLGLVASCVGIAAGYLLALTFFSEVPSYLATVFSVTGQQTIQVGTVLVAIACGLLASLLASLSPVFDLRPGRPVDGVLRDPGEPGQDIDERAIGRLALIGVTLLALLTVGAILDSSLTIVAGVMLALVALCLVPLLFRSSIHVLKWFARKYHGGMLAVAAIEMDATATRSIVLAGVAALAVYGSVAVGGARRDLLSGLDAAISQQWGGAPIWVTPDGNIFDADTFRIADPPALARRAGGLVSATHVHQGGFVDLGDHRLWIRAVPPTGGAPILSSQLLAGNLARAGARIREGGWAAVSSGFAHEHGLRLGSAFALPTPSGQAPFRVAAITTNIGWPSGTITIGTRDYSRYWRTVAPTALSFDLAPHASPVAAKEALAAALSTQPTLRVQSSKERVAEVTATVHQGLGTLSKISTLLLVTAALALATALATAIYQRRSRLASLKAQGFDRLQLWRSLLLESTIVLAAGCLDGALLGLYGHALADRYLRTNAGFPAPFAVGGLQVVATLALMLGIALAVIALPGYSAAGISPRAGFQE
jgi:putative ABC transport system permease protein